jgi:hypothetical protein
VSIATQATSTAMVLDVENGDATPGQVPGWLTRMRARGIDGSPYCNLSTWNAVKLAIALHSLSAPPYWVSRPDGRPVLEEGSASTQFAFGAPGTYDTSVCEDTWPPVPIPVTPTQEDDDVLLMQGSAPTVWLVTGGVRVALTASAQETALLAAGVRKAQDPTLDAVLAGIPIAA